MAPWSIEQLARQVPKEEFHRVSWREGSLGEQSSRFAAVRVHSAERHVHGAAPSEQVWLLLEWPEDEKVPTKYYLCSLPAATPGAFSPGGHRTGPWPRYAAAFSICCCAASATARSADGI